jgi:DNA adenine methylase
VTTAKPFLKWAGGKRRLLPELLPRVPAKFGRYFEPFLGGGALFFALSDRLRGGLVELNDANEELANAYNRLEDSATYVCDVLDQHARKHLEQGREYYDAVRTLDPKHLGSILRAARFIYLNRTCFNGLYRVNKSGAFNVPFGKYKNPTICDRENLALCRAALSRAVIRSTDFVHACDWAQRGDFVYFDPPYVPASATADFTAYTAGGFGASDHERLAALMGKLDERGVYVMLSNSDTPYTRELYYGFLQERVPVRRSISAKSASRGEASELIVRNYW